MKRTILNIAAIVLCTFAAMGQSLIREVGGFENPESVAAWKNYLFVTNMGPRMEPMAKDGDGYISQLSRKDGKVITEKYYTGLNSPKGLFIYFGVMYVADVDKVVAINIKSKKKLWEADFSKYGVKYLNDITQASGHLLVTSTDKNAIFMVDYKGKVIKNLQIKGDITGANGITRQGDKLLVSNYGKDGADGSFGQIWLGNRKYMPLHKGGVYDGVQFIAGRMIVSDWGNPDDKGKILVYNAPDKMTEINLGRSINGPSDIFRDGKTHTLWIPAMREGKIVSVSMKEVKKQVKESKEKKM